MIDPYSFAPCFSDHDLRVSLKGSRKPYEKLEQFFNSPGYKRVSFVVWAPSQKVYTWSEILIPGISYFTYAFSWFSGCRELFVPLPRLRQIQVSGFWG